jgi:hypothetical protein
MRQDRVCRITPLIGLAFGLAILLPVVAAQAADDSERAAPDPRTRVVSRLLHSGGGVVRADSRWVDDHWEIRQDGEWRALPSGWVTEVKLEKDVLKESARRIGAARRGGPVEHVELAEWMFTEGLYKEAFATLDDVLLEHPDHPAALGLLHSGTLPIMLPPIDVPTERLPEAHAALLDYAAGSPPALREIAVHRLTPTADPDGLRDAIGPRLTDRSAGVRASAMLTLHRLPPRAVPDEGELPTLLRRAVLDRADEVRRAASLALGDVGEEGLIVPIVAALDSKHPQVRMNAAQSLGLMGYRAAVEPLVNSLVNLAPGDGAFRPRGTIHVGGQIAFVQDFDVDIAQSAAIGDPSIGTLQEGATLDVRVMGVSGPSMAAQSAMLREALEKLTGAQPGKTRGAWKSWWEANHAAYTDAPIGDPDRYAPR